MISLQSYGYKETVLSSPVNGAERVKEIMLGASYSNIMSSHFRFKLCDKSCQGENLIDYVWVYSIVPFFPPIKIKRKNKKFWMLHLSGCFFDMCKKNR